MQYVAMMSIGDTKFELVLHNEKCDFRQVREDAEGLASKLGARLNYVGVGLGDDEPKAYQLTPEDQAFISLYLDLEKPNESLYDRGVESRYLREQIEIWHNDKPQATQTEFHTLYSLWSKALTLGCKPAEVIVHVDNGVLRAVYSDSDKVKCTAVQTDSDDVVEEVQAADATLARAGKMWSIF